MNTQHFLVVVDSAFDDRITGQASGGLIGDDRTTLVSQLPRWWWGSSV